MSAINADRIRYGVRPLILSDRQSRCSVEHSRHMSREGVVSHDQFPRDICVRHIWYGENVGFFPAADPMSVLSLDHWMISEGACPHRGCPGREWEEHGHYLNLLNPVFRHVGIGIVMAANAVWLTEDFTS